MLNVCSPAKLRVGFQECICLFWNFLAAEQFWRFESSKKRAKDKPPSHRRQIWKTQVIADKAKHIHRL